MSRPLPHPACAALVDVALEALEEKLDADLAAGKPPINALAAAAYRASTFVLTATHHNLGLAVTNDDVVAAVATRFGRTDDTTAPDDQEGAWYAAARVALTRRALMATGLCDEADHAAALARMDPWSDDDLERALR